MKNRKLSALDVMRQGPVIPVLVIENIRQAVPIAQALVSGGIRVLEVTLRTECALEAISLIAKNVPAAITGAGTVTNPSQYDEAIAAGAEFVISPGVTDSLLMRAADFDIPFLPGISTVSELMQGMEAGLKEFKFFPAEANGGTKAIKAVSGPLSTVRFCPTGGITPLNALSYLALPNVECVGGSWLVTQNILRENNYPEITRLALEASALTPLK